jgi:hypothetical protein
MKKNNIDLSVLGDMLQRANTEPSVLKLHKRVEGAWSFAGGAPAFSATLAHGDRKSVLEADVARPFRCSTCSSDSVPATPPPW